MAQAACAGLTIRDASMVADGVPGRLRPAPAALLRLELAVGVVAVLAGLPLLLNARPAGQAAPAEAGAAHTVWQAAVATLFAVHTVRFGIYLRPDQGRRETQPELGPVLASTVPPDAQHQTVPRCARR